MLSLCTLRFVLNGVDLEPRYLPLPLSICGFDVDGVDSPLYISLRKIAKNKATRNFTCDIVTSERYCAPDVR